MALPEGPLEPEKFCGKVWGGAGLECRNLALPLHSCPYQSDLNNDPTSCCHCCDDCQACCADEL